MSELAPRRRNAWIIVLALLGIGDILLLWRASGGQQVCEVDATPFQVVDCSQGSTAIVIIGVLLAVIALVIGLWSTLSSRAHVKLRRAALIVLILVGILIFAISWFVLRLYGDLPF